MGPLFDGPCSAAGSWKETSFCRAKVSACSKYSRCRHIQKPSWQIAGNLLNSYSLSGFQKFSLPNAWVRSFLVIIISTNLFISRNLDAKILGLITGVCLFIWGWEFVTQKLGSLLLPISLPKDEMMKMMVVEMVMAMVMVVVREGTTCSIQC